MCFNWKKYGIIPELVDLMKDVNVQYGKTALQKHMYILQTVYDVDCEYEFKMYNFGPYCSELQNNLDLVQHWGCIKIAQNGNGYIISTGEYGLLRSKIEDFVENNETKSAFETLKKEYGSLSTKALELKATIIYVDRDLRYNKENPSEDKICTIVQALKPKFDPAEILSAIHELTLKRHILTQATN
jgi:uncharacterized protein